MKTESNWSFERLTSNEETGDALMEKMAEHYERTEKIMKLSPKEIKALRRRFAEMRLTRYLSRCFQ